MSKVWQFKCVPKPFLSRSFFMKFPPTKSETKTGEINDCGKNDYGLLVASGDLVVEKLQAFKREIDTSGRFCFSIERFVASIAMLQTLLFRTCLFRVVWFQVLLNPSSNILRISDNHEWNVLFI